MELHWIDWARCPLLNFLLFFPCVDVHSRSSWVTGCLVSCGDLPLLCGTRALELTRCYSAVLPQLGWWKGIALGKTSCAWSIDNIDMNYIIYYYIVLWVYLCVWLQARYCKKICIWLVQVERTTNILLAGLFQAAPKKDGHQIAE